jgi:hypothetical protein
MTATRGLLHRPFHCSVACILIGLYASAAAAAEGVFDNIKRDQSSTPNGVTLANLVHGVSDAAR